MYSSKVAYVAQHETLAPLATVHEAIMFAAVLRNPGKDSKTCKLLTNKLEREFRLERCKHSYIGGYDSIRGVSMPVSAYCTEISQRTFAFRFLAVNGGGRQLPWSLSAKAVSL